MAPQDPQSKADDELRRQLQSADAGDRAVEAVFILRRPDEALLPPDRVQGLADQLIDKVQTETGSEIHDQNVFRHMGSFVVAAKPEIIRRLLEQPEVESAVANRQPGGADLLGKHTAADGPN
ncbi:MAG: hypothetical protein M3P18_01420 [Actinomycetota bacterium]|nr:hypothetical protein [Actinomycetota bacterium]